MHPKPLKKSTGWLGLHPQKSSSQQHNEASHFLLNFIVWGSMQTQSQTTDTSISYGGHQNKGGTDECEEPRAHFDCGLNHKRISKYTSQSTRYEFMYVVNAQHKTTSIRTQMHAGCMVANQPEVSAMGPRRHTPLPSVCTPSDHITGPVTNALYFPANHVDEGKDLPIICSQTPAVSGRIRPGHGRGLGPNLHLCTYPMSWAGGLTWWKGGASRGQRCRARAGGGGGGMPVLSDCIASPSPTARVFPSTTGHCVWCL